MEGICLEKALGEEEHPGRFGHLIQALDKPEGELGELHHGTGHIAQQNQVLAPLTLFPVFQGVEAAAGFQTLPDGPAKIQFGAAAAALSLGGQLAVDLPGNALD